MSITWLLATTSGDPQFTRGDADLVWVDGAPAELTSPVDIIDQRFRKTVMTPLGTNLFDKTIGFPQTRILGSKSLGESTARQVASALEDMTASLITSQKEVAARVPLDQNELIDSIEQMQVDITDSDMNVSVEFLTAGGAAANSIINGLFSGLGGTS